MQECLYFGFKDIVIANGHKESTVYCEDGNDDFEVELVVRVDGEDSIGDFHRFLNLNYKLSYIN